ncbi:flagellar biosynthesis anti-sigma factor FlgM [Alkaliphilus peptidifermentans]|uniref:Negative regulator of flagellin synthesis n=1 Tax=Alkaliphilus peptidifermentans DSM 18978 TaxID=1120976 RepID=A0A1G5JEZ5_9FIRM|nr:flagellar biosynthesis anti-sigma factor FlgM [Alkaliphilus peptidifermentans]SCY86926.1 anti-sigma-28 factor, FlgM family [Alkaliphilus peptidifermentans DSM 18978]
MKIFNNPNITKVMKIYDKANKTAAEGVKGADFPKDKLELSNNVKELQMAFRALKNLPEIREEKVKEIKDRIQQGTYNVTGSEIAEKMLEGIQIDKKI